MNIRHGLKVAATKDTELHPGIHRQATLRYRIEYDIWQSDPQ